MEILFQVKNGDRTIHTTRVRLICTLRTKLLTKIHRHSSLFAPALSGSTARPRAATLPIIADHNYASGKAGGLRASSGDCGARLAARGRPASPDARRIVTPLGRRSLLWGSDKAGARTRDTSNAPSAGNWLSSPLLISQCARVLTPAEYISVSRAGSGVPQGDPFGAAPPALTAATAAHA
jgi:hypothetical protein